MDRLVYAVRSLRTDASPAEVEERLNEARARGWELHTFAAETDAMCATVVFRWVGQGAQITPFAAEE